MVAMLQENGGAVPRIVGLTGGVGSGKSRVRQMFEALGVPALDADHVARQIHQNPAHPALALVAARFPHLMTADACLQRGVLYRYFVTRPDENRALKAILKPYVMAEMRAWTARQRSPYVVWESALLLEEAIPVDRILYVDATELRRIERIRGRNADLSDAQICSLMRVQMPRETYLKQAHDVIVNHSTLEQLQDNVGRVHQEYNAQWRHA